MSISPIYLGEKCFRNVSNTKLLFVGDVHGRTAIVDSILEKYLESHRVVFLGDILDSKKVGPMECVRLLSRLIDLVKDDKVDLLLGNHELSYLYPKMKCAGFKQKTALHVGPTTPLGKDLLRWALPFIWFKDAQLLATHAGLDRDLYHALWTEDEPDHDDVMENLLYSYCSNSGDPANLAYRIGVHRGGGPERGGIFWLDWGFEFLPIEGLNQISGHTRRQSIGAKKTKTSINWNIDCLGGDEPACLEIQWRHNRLEPQVINCE